MKRRTVLGMAVGGMAAVAGAGVAWLSRRPREDDVAGIWTQRFRRPGGGELALAEWRGKPLLLNFWATWCVPCAVEMPLLDKFQDEQRAAGWQVIGLAIDQEEAVGKFVGERGIRFPVALAGAAGFELIRTLGNRSGGLPFSVVFGTDGRVRARKLGVLDAEILAGWAAAP